MNHESQNISQDKILVEAAVNGEEKAFSNLFNKYKNTIYLQMLKMVNNMRDAEDLTFEAFAKAFRNIHRYSHDYAFSTWLFRIAYNNCVDFLRTIRGIATDNKEESEWEKLKSSEPDPEQRLIRIQRTILLRRIVHRLKPGYRNLIELRYFRELSYEEIAKELNTPIGTVKAQLFRARGLLVKLIETENEDLWN